MNGNIDFGKTSRRDPKRNKSVVALGWLVFLIFFFFLTTENLFTDIIFSDSVSLILNVFHILDIFFSNSISRFR